MSFDTAAVNALISAAVSHAMTTGAFRTVNSHEPKSAPGSGLRASIWAQSIEPITSSGLAATSCVVTLNLRIYGNMLQKPEDDIDPRLMAAVSALMDEYTGDFTFGGTIRHIDLLGMYGTPMKAIAGYVEIAGTMYRIMTMTIPCVINDLWVQGGIPSAEEAPGRDLQVDNLGVTGGATIGGTLNLAGSPAVNIAAGAASGSVLASDSLGDGSWLPQSSLVPVGGIVNLAAYGSASAAGTAINAAMAALPASGGTIMIPAGTWTVDEKIAVSKSGITLQGAGPSSVLAFNAASIPTMLGMADTTQRHFSMRHLKIAQTGTLGTGTALNLSYFVNSVFEHLRIGDGQNPQFGIYFNAIGSYYNVVRDSRITANSGTGNGCCVYLGTTCNSNIIENCRLLGDATTTGVYCNGNGVIIDRVDMEAAGLIGIHMDASAQNFTIINPYLEDLTTGIQLESGAGPGTLVNGDLGGCTTPITDNGAVGFAWQNTWAWSTSLPNSVMSSSSTATQLWGVKESADTVARLAANSAGKLSWGPGGSTAADVTLSRSGAQTLSLAGGFTVTGPLAAAGVLDWLNAKNPAYGATGNGTTDDTTAIAAALTAAGSAGTVYLPAGSYLLNGSSGLTVPGGVRLTAAGHGAVSLVIGTSFTGSAVLTMGGDGAAADNFSIVGASSTLTSNPACNGIELTGRQRVKVDNIFGQFVNGWILESVGSASRGCLDSMFTRVTGRNCAGGIHVKGVTGSGWAGEQFFSNIQLQNIGASSGANAGLDAFLVEDCNDILVENYNGAVAGGSLTGNTIHVKGNCSSVQFTATDVGMIAIGTTSATVLVEAGTNGTPSGIEVNGGVVQAGNQGISVTGGLDVRFRGLKVKGNNGDGASVSGGDQILFSGCNFGATAANNQSGGTAYDVDLTLSAGFVWVQECILATAVGSGAGNVANSANDANHRGLFYLTSFRGTNSAPSNCFATAPQIVRDCQGYNPRGSVTPATIGASPATVNTSQNDVNIIFTAVNGMTAFAINSTSVGAVPQVGVPYHVNARTNVTVTWSGTAPTWEWIAD